MASNLDVEFILILTLTCCGEIDIMEHKGNEPNVISWYFHYPGRPEEMQMEIKYYYKCCN
jgi:hypothetical protein